MSGPIKVQIAQAIKGLTKLRSRKDLDIMIAENTPAFEQCIRLDAQLKKIRNEIKLGYMHLADIRTAISSWTDLLRKLAGDERKAGNEEFERYQQKEELTKLVDLYEATLLDLVELESELTIDLNLAEVIRAGDARKEEFAHAKAMAEASGASSSTAVAGGASGSAFGTIYQLPTLKLKSFHGDRRKWPEFFESFRAAVDKRPGSEVEKLTLLRTLLEGEPRELIAGFKLIDKNYQEALKLLKDTYGDKGAYIRGLHVELAGLKHASTLEETRHLYLELERIARELKNAGEEIEGPAIYIMLEKKLNKNFLRTILTVKGENPDDWSTTKFRATLQDAVQKESAIQEVMTEYGLQRKPIQPAKQSSIKQEDKRPDYTYAVAEGNSQSKGKNRGAKGNAQKQKPTRRNRAPVPVAKNWPPPCAFCQQTHWNKDCTTFPSAQARINAARQAGRCLKCLRTGHTSRNCQRTTNCFHCQKDHPSAICYGAYPSNPNVAANQLLNVSDNRGVHLPSTLQTSGKPAEQQNVVQQKGTKALLMTLEVTVFNPARPHLSTLARVFLDPGSHRSFVTAELADRLQLPVNATEHTELCTFGEKQLKKFTSDLVRLSLLAIGGERITLAVNKLNFIVNPMPIYTVADLEMEGLEHLKLNSPSAHAKPDILLGMDIWHDLNVRAERQLPSGFVISNSRIGRMISGTGQIADPFSVHTIFALSVMNPEITEKTARKEASGKETRQTEPKEPDKSKAVLDSTLYRRSKLENSKKFSAFHQAEMKDATHPTDLVEVKPNLITLACKYAVKLPSTKLASTRKKQRALALIERCQAFLDEKYQKGIIQLMDPTDANGLVHHLTHLSINFPDRATTKLRFVLDVRTYPLRQSNLSSLNDCRQSLSFRIMERFPLNYNEKATLGVRAADRDESHTLRVEKSANVNLQLEDTRFCQANFGQIFTSLLLNATIRGNLSLYESEVAQEADIQRWPMFKEEPPDAELQETIHLMLRYANHFASGLAIRAEYDNTMAIIPAFRPVNTAFQVTAVKLKTNPELWNSKIRRSSTPDSREPVGPIDSPVDACQGRDKSRSNWQLRIKEPGHPLFRVGGCCGSNGSRSEDQ